MMKRSVSACISFSLLGCTHPQLPPKAQALRFDAGLSKGPQVNRLVVSTALMHNLLRSLLPIHISSTTSAAQHVDAWFSDLYYCGTTQLGTTTSAVSIAMRWTPKVGQILAVA
jgi:hypothetical protein